MDLARAREEYLSYLAVERGCSPNTIDAYGRDLTRYVAWLAERGVTSPDEVTLELVEAHAGDPRRSHVGWWLLAEPLGRPRRERTGALYALSALMAAALVSAAAGLVSGGLLTALLALLPALEIALSRPAQVHHRCKAGKPASFTTHLGTDAEHRLPSHHHRTGTREGKRKHTRLYPADGNVTRKRHLRILPGGIQERQRKKSCQKKLEISFHECLFF